MIGRKSVVVFEKECVSVRSGPFADGHLAVVNVRLETVVVKEKLDGWIARCPICWACAARDNLDLTGFDVFRGIEAPP